MALDKNWWHDKTDNKESHVIPWQNKNFLRDWSLVPLCHPIPVSETASVCIAMITLSATNTSLYLTVHIWESSLFNDEMYLATTIHYGQITEQINQSKHKVFFFYHTTFTLWQDLILWHYLDAEQCDCIVISFHRSF